MRRLLLLACSDAKDPSPDLAPAIERYNGPAYRVLRAHRARGHRLPTIMILSAQYGLIEANHPIGHYDKVLEEKDLSVVIDSYRGKLHTPVWNSDTVFVYGGELYRRVFQALMPQGAKSSPLKPLDVPVAYSRGRIGEQLHQLKEWLER